MAATGECRVEMCCLKLTCALLDHSVSARISTYTQATQTLIIWQLQGYFMLTVYSYHGGIVSPIENLQFEKCFSIHRNFALTSSHLLVSEAH